jgi:hypothetical protein
MAIVPPILEGDEFDVQEQHQKMDPCRKQVS